MTVTKRYLSDEDAASMLALSKDADSVELKLTVPATDHQATVAALDMDPLDSQIRQVYFFETPELSLSTNGVVVRGRRVQGRDDDTVVKLRPVIPSALPGRLRKQPGFGVEIDAMPGGYVCSASLKGSARADVRHIASARLAPRKLFTKAQREFYAQHAPEGVTLDDLSIFGPIFVLKLKLVPKSFGRKLVAEMWLYPDGSRILELSTKCAPNEAFQVAAELRAVLTERGVNLDGEQETKTRKALLYFAERAQVTMAPA
jgi:hypothetical protein